MELSYVSLSSNFPRNQYAVRSMELVSWIVFFLSAIHIGRFMWQTPRLGLVGHSLYQLNCQPQLCSVKTKITIIIDNSRQKYIGIHANLKRVETLFISRQLITSWTNCICHFCHALYIWYMLEPTRNHQYSTGNSGYGMACMCRHMNLICICILRSSWIILLLKSLAFFMVSTLGL